MTVDPRGAITGVRGVAGALTDLERRANRTRLIIRNLFVFGGIGASVRAITQLSDAFTVLQNRLRVVTSGQRELVETTEELLEAANNSRSGFEETAGLYSRLALATRQLNLENTELVGIVESVNKAIILSGATASEARNGLIQFSQGLAAGRLQGRDLRSVLEQLPVVADIIAARLGVTRGELRELGAQGALTSELIIDAFQNAEEVLDQGFANTVPTLGQSFVVLRNNVIAFLGSLNEGTGAIRGLSSSVLFVANNIEELVKGLQILSLTFVQLRIASVINDLGGLQGALVATTARVRALTAALAANPLGLLAVALATIISSLFVFRNEIQLTEDDLGTLGDLFAEFVDRVMTLLDSVPELFRTAFGEAFGDVVQFITDLEFEFADLIRVPALFVDNTIGLFLGLNAALGSIVDGLGDLLFSRFTAVVNRVGDTFENLADLFNATISTISQVTEIFIRGQLAAFRSLGEAARQSLLGNFEAAAQLAQQAATESAAAFGLAGREIGARFTNNLRNEFRTRLIPELRSPIASSFQQLGLDALNAFSDAAAFGQVTDFVNSLIAGANQRGADRAAGESSPTDSIESTTEALANLQDQANQTGNSITRGLAAGLTQLQMQFGDVAKAAQTVLVGAFNTATDALVEFTETGKFSFSDFARSIIKDITRVIAQLLILRAVQAIGQSVGGDFGSFIAGAIGGARQRGGVVTANRPFLVGEEGPEIFTPGQTGSITPTDQTIQALTNGAGGGKETIVIQAPAPSINVQNMIVQDPEEIPRAIESPSGEQAVINVIAKNPTAIQRSLS